MPARFLPWFHAERGPGGLSLLFLDGVSNRPPALIPQEAAIGR